MVFLWVPIFLRVKGGGAGLGGLLGEIFPKWQMGFFPTGGGGIHWTSPDHTKMA